MIEKLIGTMREDLERDYTIVMEVHRAYAERLAKEIKSYGLNSKIVTYGSYNSTCVLVTHEPIRGNIPLMLYVDIATVAALPCGKCDEYKTIDINGEDVYIQYMNGLAVYDTYFAYIEE